MRFHCISLPIDTYGFGELLRIKGYERVPKRDLFDAVHPRMSGNQPHRGDGHNPGIPVHSVLSSSAVDGGHVRCNQGSAEVDGDHE